MPRALSVAQICRKRSVKFRNLDFYKYLLTDLFYQHTDSTRLAPLRHIHVGKLSERRTRHGFFRTCSGRAAILHSQYELEIQMSERCDSTITEGNTDKLRFFGTVPKLIYICANSYGIISSESYTIRRVAFAVRYLEQGN